MLFCNGWILSKQSWFGLIPETLELDLGLKTEINILIQCQLTHDRIKSLKDLSISPRELWNCLKILVHNTVPASYFYKKKNLLPEFSDFFSVKCWNFQTNFCFSKSTRFSVKNKEKKFQKHSSAIWKNCLKKGWLISNKICQKMADFWKNCGNLIV